MTDLVVADGQEAVNGSFEIHRLPPWREGRNDSFLGTETFHRPNCWTQVAIGRYKERGVVSVLHSVLDQRGSDINVRFLLLIHDPGGSTPPAPAVFLLETTVNDSHQRAVIDESVQVLRLALFAFEVVADTSGEVGDLLQGLARGTSDRAWPLVQSTG